MANVPSCLLRKGQTQTPESEDSETDLNWLRADERGEINPEYGRWVAEHLLENPVDAAVNAIHGLADDLAFELEFSGDEDMRGIVRRVTLSAARSILVEADKLYAAAAA